MANRIAGAKSIGRGAPPIGEGKKKADAIVREWAERCNRDERKLLRGL